MNAKPTLILIAGPTCAGKSSIAAATQLRLPVDSCAVLALDRYYVDLKHLAPGERSANNFDHPDSMDWPLLKAQVHALLRGSPVAAPEYDFAHHVRALETSEIAPRPFLIVEGILALHDPILNALATLRVFVDAPNDACLSRRIARDAVERGRSLESVHAQFQTTVMPMAEQFVRPSRIHADLNLDGSHSLDSLVEHLYQRIRALRSTCK